MQTKKKVVLTAFVVLIFFVAILIIFPAVRNTFFAIFEVVDQCSDGIQNFDETGVDCGGSCSACSSGSPSPGGGGGGGGTTSVTPSVNDTRSVENAGAGSVASFSGFNLDTRISEISVQVIFEVQDLGVTVLKYDNRPSAVSVQPQRNIYRYLQIETENIQGNLENATIRFFVEKSWVSDNILETSDVALFRFDEQSQEWGELETNLVDEGDIYYNYETLLTSFSYFAIADKRIILSETGRNFLWLWVSLVVIVLAIIVFMVYRRRKISGINSNLSSRVGTSSYSS